MSSPVNSILPPHLAVDDSADSGIDTGTREVAGEGPMDGANRGASVGRTARPWQWTPFTYASLGLHLAAAGLLAAHPRAWKTVAAALALDHLALSGAGCFPHKRWLGPVSSTLRGGPAFQPGGLPRPAQELPDIALSFDDGPDPEITPQIADMLEAHGVRASFFVIGERAARHPHVIERLHGAGHRIENHTDSHAANFAFSFLPRLRREIAGCQRTVTELTGRAPAYFRAPAGMRNPLLEGALAEAGLHLVSWTRRAYDTIDGSADRILGKLSRGLARGDILLLHDGNAARTPSGRAVCLDVLPRLLNRLDELGLEAGPLPEPAPQAGDLPRAAAGE